MGAQALVTEANEPSEVPDGFIPLQPNPIPHSLCQGSYGLLTGSSFSISRVSTLFPLLRSLNWCDFGVRDSPSSQLHLIPGQFGILKASGSTHCVQDKLLVFHYVSRCPRSPQPQGLPTLVASLATRAPPRHAGAVLELLMQLSYQMFFGLIAFLNYTNTISAPQSII